jgi:hypothetical protein
MIVTVEVVKVQRRPYVEWAVLAYVGGREVFYEDQLHTTQAVERAKERARKAVAS